MIRTFFRIVLIFLFISAQSVFANVVRVNDITFDSSDSVIFISTSGSGGTVQVKKGILTNPERIFFDIENAVLTRKQGSFDFKNGKLSNLKISQFSTEPNIVRVVMTYTDKLQAENVKILSLGGNIIIKLENYKPSQDYLTPIYREVKSSAYDYFEKVRVSEAEPDNIKKEITLTPITLAPAEPSRHQSIQIPQITPPQNEPVRINPPLQESKLRSRYFVSNAFVKQGALLIAGTGIVNLEKVFFLSNPSRVIFDIPNAISSAQIRNQEFQLNETDTAKIGQFEPTKIRIVITTPEPQKYKAIYANDLQNILLVKENKISDIKLFSNTSNILYASVQTQKEYRYNVDTLTLDFSEPIVHSLKRHENVLEVDLYNVEITSLAELSQKIKAGNIKNTIVDKIGNVGVKLLIPIKRNTTLDCLENLQATKLVLTIKTPVAKQITNGNLNNKQIVIDAGHGGTDPGAMRDEVLEKQLTLDIAKLVARNLEAQGANVYMTREDDTFISLNDRVEFSNAKEPDIFVSIHINASENEAVNGLETHYYKEDSLEFAKQIHKALILNINENNRGIFKSRFYVVRHTTAPSVLLELGFISNEEERALMQTRERQEEYAAGITEGIINYLNNTGTN